jgi:hypothetical protein
VFLLEAINSKILENTLRQDGAFFDAPENSTGRLTLRLATDAPAVQAVGIFFCGACPDYAARFMRPKNISVRVHPYKSRKKMLQKLVILGPETDA